MHRAREWDAVVLVDAAASPGSVARFVVLPDGSCVPEGEQAGVSVDSLSQALGREPPYRAEAVGRDDRTWAVGIRAIQVVELPSSVLGDELEVVWDGRERSTRVGGVPTLASVGELEALARARFDTWIVRANRLRGTYWEIEIGPL